jgi:hypothetical protein
LRFQLEQLGNEAAKYSNFQLDEDAGREWRWFVANYLAEFAPSNAFISTLSEAQLVLAANCCASVVYDPNGEASAPGLDFGSRRGYLAPSTAGTSKATGFWVLNQIGTGNILEPVVIVSVRGTASVLDAMVNLNGQKQPAHLLIVS